MNISKKFHIDKAEKYSYHLKLFKTMKNVFRKRYQKDNKIIQHWHTCRSLKVMDTVKGGLFIVTLYNFLQKFPDTG